MSAAKVPAPGDIDYIETLIENGYVTLITTERPETKLKMMLGQESPRISGGYGGWGIVPRPRQRGLVEWLGVEPMEVTFGVLFDSVAWPRTVGGWEDWDLREAAHNVTEAVNRLEMFAKPKTTGRPSPTFRVEGALVPSTPTMTWVMSELKWGDTLRNTEGFIIRQEATLTILQADGAEHLRVLPPVKKHDEGKGGGKGKVPQFHTWKKGNTFKLLSIRYHGNPDRGPDIMKLNKIRDWKKVKAGQKIKLPRPK